MYLCYIDESGVSGLNNNTSHFVLAGIAIPIYHWKTCEKEIDKVKAKYSLQDKEIHTGWILRRYYYQERIPHFETLSIPQRISEVQKTHRIENLKLQKTGKAKAINQAKKNYKHIEPYIHLTLDQRKAFVKEIAETIGRWGFARLFAECINIINFDERIAKQTADEQALEQVVSRFQHYLESVSKSNGSDPKLGNSISPLTYGLLIHDNNFTVAKRHTLLMKKFHEKGTFWNNIKNIIETPLFVDSSLTSMIQIADVCAYALRRYIENREEELFKEIFKRVHRIYNNTVGIRHYAISKCTCTICSTH